jgi:hypothetical protein
MELLESLTEESVQTMKNKGLTKEWVEEYLEKYTEASKIPRKLNAKNPNLLPRIEVLKKILELW